MHFKPIEINKQQIGKKVYNNIQVHVSYKNYTICDFFFLFLYDSYVLVVIISRLSY